MPLTTRASARRAGSIIASFGVLLTMLLAASPAQAAPIVNISASDTSITLGESVTLTWTSSDTTTLTADDDWTGSKAVPNGAEEITPTEAGTYTYTLVAGNDSDPDSSDSVTVTVAPGPITPEAVTFPDPCTVVIPSTPNVTYFVDYGDDTEELEAGEYDGPYFSDPDFPVTFVAVADDGFSFADNAVTEWDYTAPEECFEFNEGPELVSSTVKCGSVTFTNTTDGPLDVIFVSFDDEFDELADFTLAAGASRTIKTTHSDTAFAVFEDIDGDEDPVQIRYLEVPQDCGDGNDGGAGDDSDHPTVAPAAGIAAR